MPNSNETILTVKEAAEYLRIHPITLYRLLEKDKVPGAFKIGNQWRLKKETIESQKNTGNREFR